MGNVIHRGKGSFTFVENTIFFDHGLSAKAKGICCQIRSLENNPEWVFAVKGFASLVRDGADAVSAGIKELESSGYIIRTRKRSENGRFLKRKRPPGSRSTTRSCTRRWRRSSRRTATPSSRSSRESRPPTWSSSRRRSPSTLKTPRSVPERENPYLEKPHLGKPSL